MSNPHFRQRAERTQPPRPVGLRQQDPEAHGRQAPVAFVLACLAAAAGLLALAGLGVLWGYDQTRGLGEPLPDFAVRGENRWDRPAHALAVETAGDGRATRLLAVDDERLHVGEPVKDLVYPQSVRLRDLRPGLPAPDVVGLTAHEGRLVLVCEEGYRRGLAAFDLPARVRDASGWEQPLTDLSFFPGIDDQHASCILSDAADGSLLVGGFGFGIYRGRGWRGAVTQQNGLASELVFDLEFLPGGELAVMGDGGIDLGRWAQREWKTSAHFGGAAALAGEQVRHGRMAGGDLVYVTAAGGLGRLRPDAAGRLRQAEILVREGRAPGLSKSSLLRAAEDGPQRRRVWMVYAISDKKLSAARYRDKDHHMLGLPPDAAWPAGEVLTLRADPYGDAAGAWVGGDGVRRVTEAGAGDRLDVTAAGLAGHQVDELAVHPRAVFAHTRLSGDEVTLQAAPRGRLAEQGAGAWTAYIGPRRFPDLQTGDLRAATEGSVEGQPAILFGTGGKGIGAFFPATREMFRAHHSGHADPGHRLPDHCDNVLDLSARGPQVAVVGAGHSLAFFDGDKWHVVIDPEGADVAPGEVLTIVAGGKDLVIGSTDKIARYRADTHAWERLPPVPGLERLVLGAGRLWAIDKEKKLHGLPLDGMGEAWKQEETDVREVYGDGDLLAVLAGSRARGRLWVWTKGDGKKDVVNTAALPAGGKAWTAAATAGKRLYVAPHAGGVGLYDLRKHQWSEIDAPSGAEGVSQLVATVSGLWLLDGAGRLFCVPHGEHKWHDAAVGVKWLGHSTGEVIALGQAGQVWTSTGGMAPMTQLVGDAFRQPLAEVTTGVVFKDNLFVATPKLVGRYDAGHHHWVSYDAAAVPGARALAATAGHLYLCSTAGRLLRWQEKEDGWRGVTAGDKALRVRQIAAGGGVLFIRPEEGGLMALSDETPDTPRTLLLASKLGKGKLTAAAELDGELFVGLEGGRVSCYGRAGADGPRAWSTVLDDKAGGAVSALLAPPGPGRRLVAAADKVLLLEQPGKGAPWEKRTLLDQKVDGSAVTADDFYGYSRDGDKAGLWRAGLAGAADKPQRLIGTAFPGGEPTVAVGLGPGQELFRAGKKSALRYDFAEHAWVSCDLDNKQVRGFLGVEGKELWAWVPDDQTLFGWNAPAWVAPQEYKGSVLQVTGNGSALALIDKDGAVHVRTPKGDTKLLPGLEKPLPIKGPADVTAAAQLGDVLFLAAKDQPLLEYTRQAHAWATVPAVKGVVEFARVGATDGAALFALDVAGAVHRRGAGGSWKAVEDLAKVKSLTATDDSLVARGEDGGLTFLDGTGKVTGKLSPKFLEGRKATDMRPVAAAELDGKLLLVPEVDPKELWVYDPQASTWESQKLEGNAERFLPSTAGLWLAVRADKSLSLYRVTGKPPRTKLAQDKLLDAVSDGNSVWVLTGNNEVRHTDADGNFVEVPGVALSALPEKAQVHRAVAVADACVVLLKDGSVHHYSASDRRWGQKLAAPKEMPADPGSLSRVGDHGAYVLFRTGRDIWVCDPAKPEWTRAQEKDGIPQLPAPPAKKVQSRWTVTEKDGNFAYEVKADDKAHPLTLVNGRFDWDRPTQLAVKADTLILNTPGGVRKFKRGDDKKWKEELGDIGPFPAAGADGAGVTLSGTTVFSVGPDEGGAFPAPNGKRLSIRMSVGKEKMELRPAQAATGAGFAHDVIRDVAALKKDLWLATAGGAVCLRDIPTRSERAEIAGPTEGLDDPDLSGVAVVEGQVVVRSGKGQYHRRAADAPKWEAVDAKQSFQEARGVGRSRALLQDWGVSEPAGGGLGLSLKFGKETFPVSLTERGFGFDQPRALVLGDKVLRLYTPDGRVDLDAAAAGPVLAASAAHKLPAFDGYADVFEGGKGAWLRTPEKAWHHDGSWKAVKPEEYEAEWKQHQPLFADTDGLKWSRDGDRVTFKRAGVNARQPFETRFDLARGRFLLDVPLGVATADGRPWALTAGGLVRYDPDGTWTDVALTDPKVIDGGSRLISLPMNRLVLKAAGGKLHEWAAGKWQEAASPEKLKEEIDLHQRHLLRGRDWEVEVDGSGKDRAARARSGAKKEFVAVSLDEEGLFDFEDVRDALDDGAACHLATRLGLARIDSVTGDFTDLWKPPSAATRLGRLDKGVYAELGSRGVLEFAAGGGGWKAAEAADVFDRISRRVVSARPWTWERGRDKPAVLTVSLEPAKGGLWAGEQPLTVGLVEGRFEFDAVHDVGIADRAWLVTAAGLVGRRGKEIEKAPIRIPGAGKREGRTLFDVTPNTEPVLHARTETGLVRYEKGKWLPLGADESRQAEDLLKRQTTKGPAFDVVHEGASLEVRLRLADDARGLYKRVVFDAGVGLFTFDDLRCLSRPAGDEKVRVLAGTEGGVARYEVPGEDEDPLRRLYCENDIDGLGSVPVAGVVQGRGEPINLLATVPAKPGDPPHFYRLAEDRWHKEQAGDKLGQHYERLRRVVADDRDGWRVVRDAPGPGAERRPPFELHWREEPARLIDLRESKDAGRAMTRFAHDVPLSVTLNDDGIWLATRGGVVLYPNRPRGEGWGQIDTGDFRLHATKTLPAEDLSGPAPPRGLVWIKPQQEQRSRLFARRHDGTVLALDAKGAWSVVPSDDPDVRSASVVAGGGADAFLSWVKDPQAPVRLAPNERRLRVAANYPWLTNGTWSFLETGLVKRGDPHRSMAFVGKHLYLATPGGVARFAVGDEPEPLSPPGPTDFVSDVYAVARGDGGPVPMLNVEELYYDAEGDRLYARAEQNQRFLFDPASDSWALDAGGPDPFAAAAVVVKNDLLRCEMRGHDLEWTVLPLREDMPDQSRYPLFHDGRFAFDVVHAFAWRDDRLWLATEGAACEYDRQSFAPLRYCAREMTAAGAELPQVREVVRDPVDGARLVCRTGAGDMFRLDGRVWRPGGEAETVLAAYTRADDPLLRWVQYPEGALEAHVKAGVGAAVLGTKRGRSSFPLFSNNRFAFDDVRGAVLHGRRLWSATPAGVVEHEVDWQAQAAPIVAIHGLAAGSDGGAVPMADLERLVRAGDGTLLAWGKREVFSRPAGAEPAGWSEYPGLGAGEMGRHMDLPDGPDVWTFKQAPGGVGPLEVRRMTGGKVAGSGTLSSAYRVQDVSLAVMDERWVYLPLAGGGIVRVPRSRVR